MKKIKMFDLAARKAFLFKSAYVNRKVLENTLIALEGVTEELFSFGKGKNDKKYLKAIAEAKKELEYET